MGASGSFSGIKPPEFEAELSHLLQILRMHSAVPSLYHEYSWRGGCLNASEALCFTLISAISEGLDTLLNWWLVFTAKHSFWDWSSTAKPNSTYALAPLFFLSPSIELIPELLSGGEEWIVYVLMKNAIFIYERAVARMTSSRLIGCELYLNPYVSTIRS